jgi:hypothetical protein
MKKDVERLAIDELVKINSDAIKNFKTGARTLFAQRITDDPTGFINYYEDYDVQDLVNDLTLGIIDVACNSTAEGIGMLELAKNSFTNNHLRG